MTEQVWWYATRAAGLMTWSTAVASALLGLLLSTRLSRKPGGPWLLDVHRFLGGLSAVFLLIHMGSLWADSFVDFGPAELLVPGQSTWRPDADANTYGVSAVTWGIGAAYALIAVEITSILRSHLRPGVWRAVRYLSIVTVAAGSVHAYQAGTDVDNPLVLGTAVGSSILVVLLSLLRMRSSSNPESPIAQERMLTEMRQRLDGMPMPETTAQPTLEPTDQSALPRRAPFRSGGNDLKPLSMSDQLIYTPEGDTEPEFVIPAGESTLLAGLDEPVDDHLGPDPFVGLQGHDADFDPGGWSSEPSPAAGEAFSRPPTGEFAPSTHARSAEADTDAAETSPSESSPSFDEPTTEMDQVIDPRSFLSELQSPAPQLPNPEPIFHPSPHAPEPLPPPPPQPIPAEPVATEPEPVPPPPQPIPAEPVATEPEPVPTPPQPIPAEPVATEPEPEPPPPQPVPTNNSGVDEWETALESLLGEGLPKLPSFDAPEIPHVVQSAEPDVPAAESVDPPAPPPAPAPPVVEPVSPFDRPAATHAVPSAEVEPEMFTLKSPSPEPAPMDEPAPDRAPPPLPVHAIDPDTGETDEEAYKEWLVQWLAYAERYGDEAPSDPSRVDS